MFCDKYINSKIYHLNMSLTYSMWDLDPKENLVPISTRDVQKGEEVWGLVPPPEPLRGGKYPPKIA